MVAVDPALFLRQQCTSYEEELERVEVLKYLGRPLTSQVLDSCFTGVEYRTCNPVSLRDVLHSNGAGSATYWK